MLRHSRRLRNGEGTKVSRRPLALYASALPLRLSTTLSFYILYPQSTSAASVNHLSLVSRCKVPSTGIISMNSLIYPHASRPQNSPSTRDCKLNQEPKDPCLPPSLPPSFDQPTCIDDNCEDIGCAYDSECSSECGDSANCDEDTACDDPNCEPDNCGDDHGCLLPARSEANNGYESSAYPFQQPFNEGWGQIASSGHLQGHRPAGSSGEGRMISNRVPELETLIEAAQLQSPIPRAPHPPLGFQDGSGNFEFNCQWDQCHETVQNPAQLDLHFHQAHLPATFDQQYCVDPAYLTTSSQGQIRACDSNQIHPEGTHETQCIYCPPHCEENMILKHG